MTISPLAQSLADQLYAQLFAAFTDHVEITTPNHLHWNGSDQDWVAELKVRCRQVVPLAIQIGMDGGGMMMQAKAEGPLKGKRKPSK